MPLAGRIHELALAEEPVDRFRDETLVEAFAGGIDLAEAIAARRFRFAQDALEGGRQMRTPETAAGLGRLAAGKPHFRRGRPFRAEQIFDVANDDRRVRHQTEALARVGDRRREHIAKAHAAIFRQERHPGPERSGHDRGEQSVARHDVEAEATEGGKRCRLRRNALAADHLYVPPVDAIENERHLAAGPVLVRLDDMERGSGRNGRIEGVAPAFQDRHAGRRGEPVRRGDDAERAVDFGSRREHRSPRGYARCTPRSARVSVLLPCRRLRQAPFRRPDFGRATRTGSGSIKL
jgi:hypothetical protein